MPRKKILITGAAGRIGRVLREGLKNHYDLRLLYHNTILPTEPDEEVHVSSITDLDKILEAARGVDTIVHMAGNPSGGAPFEDILEANIRGTYTVYEAAHQTGVPRVIFASTNHVTGYYEKNGIYTTPEMNARPDSFYGASKAFGEDLGRYYADAHNLSVICLRIGSFQPDKAVINRKSDRILSTWLSHRDTVQLVHRSIETEIKFGIYYGISNNTRATWDIQNAREELGYTPEDNAEDHV
ncbi:MAG: NAD(P)-dependent oxidoreductase [bacterium]|nr:NAD(P)-dependent oxidoreductase [bacterium]